MTTVFVQFTDSKQTTIASVFGCAQDANVFQNQGQVDSSDQRYATYFNALNASFRMGLPVPG
jgi:hypothetical protein